MWFFLLLCYVLAAVISLAFLQFHINLFRHKLYLSVPLFLAIYMPLSITFFLPVDYVKHNSASDIFGFTINDKTILVLWKSNYWSTFLLTWLLLPVLQEFYRSGHYHRLPKLKDAFRAHLKFQAIVLLVGIAGAIYLMLEVGFSFGHLKSMVIALSHIYALILALWLMAHGLIAIPRNRWVEGNLMQNINHHYLKVPRLVDALEDSKISLKEEALKVLVLEKNYTSLTVPENFEFRDWILHLSKQIPDDLRESISRHYVYDSSNAITRSQLNENFMKNLTYNFQNHLYKLTAYESEYSTLLEQISRLQTLIDAKAAENPAERNQLIRSLRLTPFPPTIDYYFQCYVKPAARRTLSVFLFTVSFVIIQSEFFHSTKLSLMNTLVYQTGIHKHNFLQATSSSMIFSYMLFCSLNSLAKLKIFNKYHLVPRNSDPVSASFYASYIARLTIPLSYNFITLFASRDSIFEEWYGKSIHLTGLFNLMNNWIPRLLLIPIVLTTFNVYDIVKKRLGLSSDFYSAWADFDSEEAVGETDLSSSKRKDLIIVEARRIVSLELNRRNQGLGRLSNSPDSQRQNESRFDDQLARDSDQTLGGALTNRIDAFHDDANFMPSPYFGSDVWNKLGGTLNGIKNAVSTRFGRMEPSYRDDPIDSYEYDDDANENLII
ncbi:hypothetical protein ACI3LY_002476 [Candidozyma auris]|nr:hypothetical protein QG37_02157 [[Candida] auris]